MQSPKAALQGLVGEKASLEQRLTCRRSMMARMTWAIIGAIVAALLLVAALMDRSTRRRRGRTLNSKDISREVREANRDSQVIDSGFVPPRNGGDYDWTSWNRRNKGGH